MAAGRYNILIEQGATFNLNLIVKDPNGDPIDVTGWGGCAQVRKTPSDSSPLGSFTVTFPAPNTDGKILLAMTPVETANLPVDPQARFSSPSPYFYDLFITRPDNTIFKLIEGDAKVVPSVTRSC